MITDPLDDLDDTRQRADSSTPPPDDSTAKKRTRGPKKPKAAKPAPALPDTPFNVRDRRKHRFFIIYNVALDVWGPHLGVYGWAVYSYLVRYANDGETIPRSKRKIADCFGISMRKVAYELRNLEKLGLISRTARRSDGSSYEDEPSAFNISDLEGYAYSASPPMHDMHTPTHDMHPPMHDMPTPMHDMHTNKDIDSKRDPQTFSEEGSQDVQNEEGDEDTNAPPPIAPAPPSEEEAQVDRRLDECEKELRDLQKRKQRLKYEIDKQPEPFLQKDSRADLRQVERQISKARDEIADLERQWRQFHPLGSEYTAPLQSSFAQDFPEKQKKRWRK